MILFTYDQLRFFDNKFSIKRSKRESGYEPTSKPVTCLEIFNERFTNNTSQDASSCQEELEKEYANWTKTLAFSTDCVYWCDAKDYPKSIFNIRERREGKFLWYRGLFNFHWDV